MSLHPIAVVDQVLDEYRAYLATEFRARDRQLRQALDQRLDEEGFLAQEPFFQAHRPFKAGGRWTELGLDGTLARVMRERSGSETAYLHQSEAIRHLLGPQAGPLVVTTGTGSGKTECFLLPVIQNAIEDAVRFKRDGLTALLVYPMNALANDQQERIEAYLQASGHTHVRVARYDRSTKQEQREAMRRNPPHILLTNYMMLEYLLVRPADRDALFANHRCRFVVLDEVHSYRGALGANIALLFRRLLAHLRRARQDWNVEAADGRRFPSVIPVATSATIKSVDETGRSPEEVHRLRDEAVQGFLGKLTGLPGSAFRVLGEELEALHIPAEARWSASPAAIDVPVWSDEAALRGALAALSDANPTDAIDGLARRAAILWRLNEWLARRPMSISTLVERVLAEIPKRAGTDPAAAAREVRAALVVGAALPDGMPGALRLRTHRFIRGGWQFMRCVDPACGRLYPMGEARCTCGKATAPLYLCRSCGADTLRFASDDPAQFPLEPNASRGDDNEWILYERARFETEENGDELAVSVKQLRGREVKSGSFDPETCSFSSQEDDYPVPVVLAPARTRCLVCGGTAGAHDVITPVALGTSAAVRVLAEGLTEGLARQHAGLDTLDRKERLLIFADSRQDAAHQARFISYAARYDRMRRRLVQLLGEEQRGLTLDDLLTRLVGLGVKRCDNPHTQTYRDADYLPEAVKRRARAWEEAPLLDDIAVNAGYRATVLNLGLVGVRYGLLEEYIAHKGGPVAATLGISSGQLAYLCRCLLDEMRRRGALSRPMLRYHPDGPNCPEEFRSDADWDRSIRDAAGYACSPEGEPLANMDTAEAPPGITAMNAWRRERAGGRGPSLERRMRLLLQRMDGIGDPTQRHMEELLGLLMDGPKFIVPSRLHGYREARTLLQVNADTLLLELVGDPDRRRCSVCNVILPWAEEGAPCPSCNSGLLRPWDPTEVRSNRYVQRIFKADLLPLNAGEHTAQVTSDDRIRLETEFKAQAKQSPLNVLACSPTLEMGIDVGGLDAVILRNIPPRPDNYAQRGGRAGRRSRVGVVLSYARSTPHDGYFFDRPQEMIAGEVPAPSLSLGNRDVVTRHLFALAFGGAEPGLAGRMAEYVNLQGELNPERIQELIDGVMGRVDATVALALDAWGPDILGPAGLADEAALRAELAGLPGRIEDLFLRVSRQILELGESIKRWSEMGVGKGSAINAMELKKRLLGIRDKEDQEADDRTSGHPMRRFAEFGILPGYEFPSEPASLRLWGDAHEEESISVVRRFGLGQFQPEAVVHARGHRWRVMGLDIASPWNNKSGKPDWLYQRCAKCDLRYGVQEAVRCPRCGSDEIAGGADGYPAFHFGGFLAKRNDKPVLQEEDRYSMAALVGFSPQWNGDIAARWRLPTDWTAEVRRRETVRWLNEGREPSKEDHEKGRPVLHHEARGFWLCPSCGRQLNAPDDGPKKSKGRRKAAKGGADPFGHAPNCERQGDGPRAIALSTETLCTTLRILVALPPDFGEDEYLRWGYSLGYSLHIGLRHLYMLDGNEVEFHLEPMWEAEQEGLPLKRGALTFVDGAVGGSGFLERAASELHLIARRAIDHLDHPGCETACYRCLKSYTNQRHHTHLHWPTIFTDLETLAQQPPEMIEVAAQERIDDAAWVEAYRNKVGSPLELRFLRLVEKHGMAVERQVPVSPDEGGQPISVADFRVAGTNILIYIDGAAFHTGRNLRRDRAIRERLRGGGMAWRVEEWGGKDLVKAEGIIRGLAKAG